MRGIRRWLTGAAVLSGTTVLAQSPAPLATPVAEPAIMAALPGGTVVGAQHAPVASIPVLAAPTNAPAVAAPIDVPMSAPVVVPQPTTDTITGPAVGPIPSAIPGAPGSTPWGSTMPDCCGPIGAHGPVGQDIYGRFGAAFPISKGLLSKGLNPGWTGQIGARSLFFNPSGDAAWVLDGHVTYTFNNANNRQDIATFRGEPVTVRDLHRSAVGLGIGRDYFLRGPGFVGGGWSNNFSYGWDAGARWGAGHVNLNPLLETDGYRRHYDTFGQPFVGVHGTFEVPLGAYTCVMGGRVEWNYTFSDLLPKDGSFQEVSATFTFGLRY